MQLSTFAITVPKDSCRLVLFLTVLSLPRSTKRDAIRMSVTLKVILLSAPAIFKGVSNRWNGIWNGTVEWKMEWNGKCM